MATATEQLDTFKNLAENWDGYGAAEPRADVVDAAKTLLEGDRSHQKKTADNEPAAKSKRK